MESKDDYPGKQWQPIFDYMVDTFDLSLTLKEMEELIKGVSIAIGHTALQAKCDRYEKALKEIAKTALVVGQPSFMWQANEALAVDGEKESAIAKICHALAEEVAKDADTAEAYLRKEGVDVDKVKEDAKFVAWLAELAALLHGAAQGQPIKINQEEARKWYDDGCTPYQCFRETWNME